MTAPPAPGTDLRHRRWIGRLIRVGLVFVAIAVVAGWFGLRRQSKGPDFEVQWDAPTTAALGPGDLQIFSRDSSVDLILQGRNILAGLSPKTVAKVRAEIDASAGKDSGLGGSIAKLVKEQVADKIGTHVVYPIEQIHDIRYENGQIVVEDRSGNRKRLFGDVKFNKEPVSESFAEADAERFVEAVRARKRSLP